MRVGWATIWVVCGACLDEELPELSDALPALYDSCGGLAGRPCEGDLVCADTPGDGCSPFDGGADCGGICIACDDKRVRRTVISDDPGECARMDFDCPDGKVPWFDECGCGCQRP